MSTHESEKASSPSNENNVGSNATNSTIGSSDIDQAASTDFTSGAAGNATGPDGFTSAPRGAHCQPQASGFDFVDNVPDTSGGHGGPQNEAIPEPAIKLTVTSTKINGANGLRYDKITSNQLSWKVREDLPDPVYMKAYRDGNLLKQTDKGGISDPAILRNTKYSYKVQAFDANDEPYASSFTVHHVTPDALELHKAFKSVALVPLRFADTVTPQQPQQVYEDFFGVMHDYFEEASYGQFNFESTILPLVVLDMNQDGFCTGQFADGYGKTCDLAAIRIAALEKLGVDDNDYDGYVFCMNGVGGSAWNAERYSYFADHNLNTEDMVHEFAHMLGAWHADGWKCPDNKLVGPSVENVYEGGCTVPTYGDQFSILGTANLRHMHALHKYHMGWLEHSQVQTITQAGTYEISALEAPGSAPVMLRIQLSGVSPKIFYFLEYVKPIGFDSVPITQTTAVYMKSLELADQPLEGILVRLRFDQVAGGHSYQGNGETAIIKVVVREGVDFEDIDRGLTVKLVAFKPGNIAEVEILGDF